jgi:sialate O-acetylesterase
MRITRVLAALALAAGLQAAVKLPALISDHMVLQQGKPVRIWGTADPGEAVRITFQGQTVDAKAAATGKWEAWLKPLNAGGPLEMNINGAAIHDVLVGEVWLGSGQSNMELTVQRADNKDEEIAKADFPSIHIFHVKRAVADEPAADLQATWEVVTPTTIPGFSAVEYYFGRELHRTLKQPMGLIESDWGGTPAQSWTSKPALLADLGLKSYLDDWDKVLANYTPAAKEAYDKRVTAWEDAAAKARAAGNTPPPRPQAPQGPGHPNTPAGLYNAMIAPLTPYAIRGVIWYQGESNASEAHAYKYRRLFAAMIQDWRNRWGQGDFPFLFVQLPNYQTNGWWPVLRESQAETTRLNNVGMAVTIDVGDAKNLHPTNKQDVAKRLVNVALNMAYHQPVEYIGPSFQQLVNEGSQLRIHYSHADGIAVKGSGTLTGFTIAGDDGKFVAADARIDGGTVVVSSSQVSAPIAVRYAWADAPECNLINSAGLPGVPFRSDQPHYN